MTVVRTHKSSKYYSISNTTCQDPNLSWEALGLLTYCLSQPLSWEFKPKTIWKLRECGRDKIYRMFEEMIATFHCIRIRKPNKKSPNLPGEIEYEIFDDTDDCKLRIEELEKEEKFLDHGYNLKKSFRHPKFQDPEAQDPENQDYIKNDKKNDKGRSYIKNDNDSVHKFERKIKPTKKEAAPPIDYRSSNSKKPIVSSPSDQKGIGFDPTTFDPETYRLPNGQLLSLRFQRAIKKYSQDDLAKLYANIELFEDQYKKNPSSIDNLESYLQSCINKNVAGKELERYQNWIYANFIIQDNNIDNVKLMKTVIKKSGKNGDSLSLSLPPHSFADALDSFLGIRRKCNVA